MGLIVSYNADNGKSSYDKNMHHYAVDYSSQPTNNMT